jgi:hypothetical protein
MSLTTKTELVHTTAEAVQLRDRIWLDGTDWTVVAVDPAAAFERGSRAPIAALDLVDGDSDRHRRLRMPAHYAVSVQRDVEVPEAHVIGYVVQRAEGRVDDPVWPCGEAMLSEHLNGINRRLGRVAETLEDRGGYDKFDILVHYSDGDVDRLRLDLSASFESIWAELPTLSR